MSFVVDMLGGSTSPASRARGSLTIPAAFVWRAPETMTFLYYTGRGAGNSQGFGMFDIEV